LGAPSHCRGLCRSASDLRQFEPYARGLARRYPLWGSGGDEQDVAQEAMIAAWRAVEAFDGRGSMEGFVRQRMQLRVIDYVRIRNVGKRRAERDTLPLGEWDARGGDLTLGGVLDRERARVALETIAGLPVLQRERIVAATLGVPLGAIARRAGCTEKAAWQSIKSARGKVAVALAA
jgi:RNA polymerase sigma factor (sigma-70 family)